jgi:hypothetical protein
LVHPFEVLKLHHHWIASIFSGLKQQTAISERVKGRRHGFIDGNRGTESFWVRNEMKFQRFRLENQFLPKTPAKAKKATAKFMIKN